LKSQPAEIVLLYCTALRLDLRLPILELACNTVPVNKKFTFRFKRTIVLQCESFHSVTVFLSSFF